MSYTRRRTSRGSCPIQPARRVAGAAATCAALLLWSGVSGAQGGGAASADPAMLATAGMGREPALTVEAARASADSLLRQVNRIRGLEPLRPVPVEVEDRGRIRRRLEEIAREEGVEARARQDQTLLVFLGLLRPDQDLFALYKDLLEEQLAGLYDIERRVLVLADWTPADLQAPVAVHELTHALQDQHFGLRVRRKLGFETPDAEAAWAALVEGDASAVMLQSTLPPDSKPFTAVVDSAPPDLAAVVPAGPETERFRAAPRVVREALGFPYVHGVRFVAALFARGGWPQIDVAYVHPPTSTEQILHPERFGGVADRPVRVELPDLRGILGSGYEPQLDLPLGEFDLRSYLGEYIDPEIAVVASDGWGGCTVALYKGSGKDPRAFVLSSVWDSEDDALEFFGGLLGALEKRYPDQTGVAERTSTDQITWNVDAKGRFQNVVRMRERTVVCLEQVPAASVDRLFQKLDQQTRIDDPSPDVRAATKDQLPWNRPVTQAGDSALVLHVDLPEGWSSVPAERPDVVLEARRAGARLRVAIDRNATDRLGPNGYAHVLSVRIQQHGTNVFVAKDNAFPRPDGLRLYQHIFTQLEEGRQVVYYLGVAELERGFGYVQITEPKDGTTPSVASDFQHILETLRVVPAYAGTAPASARHADGAASGP